MPEYGKIKIMKKNIKSIGLILLIGVQMAALVFLFLHEFEIIQNKYIPVFAYLILAIGVIYSHYISKRIAKK